MRENDKENVLYEWKMRSLWSATDVRNTKEKFVWEGAL